MPFVEKGKIHGQLKQHKTLEISSDSLQGDWQLKPVEFPLDAKTMHFVASLISLTSQ